MDSSLPYTIVESSGPLTIVEVNDLRIVIVNEVGGLRQDTDVDFHVYTAAGQHFHGTAYSLEALARDRDRMAQNGECLSGLYENVPDLVVIFEISVDAIVRVVVDLFDKGEHVGLLIEAENDMLT